VKNGFRESSNQYLIRLAISGYSDNFPQKYTNFWRFPNQTVGGFFCLILADGPVSCPTVTIQ
jgi:hypothetical protein